MFQTQVVEEIKTRILYSVTFFENRAIYQIMWKNMLRDVQVTDDNKAHARCMLDI